MEDSRKLSLQSIQLAVDLAKAGMSPNTAAFMNNPEVVAKFIEVVSTKINSLMGSAENLETDSRTNSDEHSLASDRSSRETK